MTEFKLRPIRRDDFPHFMEWVNDPEVTHTLMLLRPIAERRATLTDRNKLS